MLPTARRSGVRTMTDLGGLHALEAVLKVLDPHAETLGAIGSFAAAGAAWLSARSTEKTVVEMRAARSQAAQALLRIEAPSLKLKGVLSGFALWLEEVPEVQDVGQPFLPIRNDGLGPAYDVRLTFATGAGFPPSPQRLEDFREIDLQGLRLPLSKAWLAEDHALAQWTNGPATSDPGQQAESSLLCVKPNETVLAVVPPWLLAHLVVQALPRGATPKADVTISWRELTDVRHEVQGFIELEIGSVAGQTPAGGHAPFLNLEFTVSDLKVGRPRPPELTPRRRQAEARLRSFAETLRSRGNGAIS